MHCGYCVPSQAGKAGMGGSDAGNDIAGSGGNDSLRGSAGNGGNAVIGFNFGREDGKVTMQLPC